MTDVSPEDREALDAISSPAAWRQHQAEIIEDKPEPKPWIIRNRKEMRGLGLIRRTYRLDFKRGKAVPHPMRGVVRRRK